MMHDAILTAEIEDVASQTQLADLMHGRIEDHPDGELHLVCPRWSWQSPESHVAA
jgi:hypothetical protein